MAKKPNKTATTDADHDLLDSAAASDPDGENEVTADQDAEQADGQQSDDAGEAGEGDGEAGGDAAEETGATTEEDVDLAEIKIALMVAALQRVAYALYPYPEDTDPMYCQAAIAELTEEGLAHAGLRPNLTSEGVIAAAKLAARRE